MPNQLSRRKAIAAAGVLVGASIPAQGQTVRPRTDPARNDHKLPCEFEFVLAFFRPLGQPST